MPYVEATEESLETAFQSFEVVSNTSVESLPMWPRMSGMAMMVVRVMFGHDYEPGMGLGKNNDGMASLVDIKENRGMFGLGYKPTQTDLGALERFRGLLRKLPTHGFSEPIQLIIFIDGLRPQSKQLLDASAGGKSN